MNNWKRNFKSKEEGIAHVMKTLFEDKDKILSKSLNGDAVFTWMGNTITLKGKKKKDEKKI